MDLSATNAAQLCGLSVRSVMLRTNVFVHAWFGSVPPSFLSQVSLRLMTLPPFQAHPLQASAPYMAPVTVSGGTSPKSTVKVTVSRCDMSDYAKQQKARDAPTVITLEA